MSHFNMTDESDFEGNEAFFEENRPIKRSIWDLVLTLIFLFSFFGCVYLYFENCTLKGMTWRLTESHKKLIRSKRKYNQGMKLLKENSYEWDFKD